MSGEVGKCLILNVRHKIRCFYPTFFVEKGVNRIPGSPEKRGLFGLHVCTMSYIGR